MWSRSRSRSPDPSDADPVQDASARTRLPRVLGLLELTASGVGIIIGAGIYVLLGAATAEAGPAVWASFGLAAVLCGLTAMSYAELASMFPKAGAEYEYTRRVLPARVAFVVGWTMAAGLMVAAAAIAVGFAHYLRYFVDVPVVAGALTLVEAVIALSGLRRSARLTLVLSAIQVGGLLVIVAVGASHIGSESLVAGSHAAGIFGGAALVFFAFIGFDEVITMAEETRHPTTVVPRALLLALGISTLLYMAVAVAAVSVVGADGLAGSNRPLADVMSHVLGGRAESVTAMIALVSTTNTSLLALTAGSRILYGMADSGALPRAVARLSSGGQVPATAIGVTVVSAMAFAALGDLTLVASVTDFAVYVVFLAVNLTVVLLRFREPGRIRPFRSPGAIGRLPLLPLAGFAAAAAMLPQLDRDALWMGVAMVAIGALACGPLRQRPDEAG
jgi:APA family basic amino acid/polyamine antiporter